METHEAGAEEQDLRSAYLLRIAMSRFTTADVLAYVLATFIATAIIFGGSIRDATRKPGDEASIPFSTVVYEGQRGSVPTKILRDMGLEEGQTVTTEQVQEMTERMVKHFHLEKR